MTTKREFELTDEDLAFIEARAAAQGIDADAVVRGAIEALRDEDAVVNAWVTDEVLPSYERWVENGRPPGKDADEVSAELHRRLDERNTHAAE